MSISLYNSFFFFGSLFTIYYLRPGFIIKIACLYNPNPLISFPLEIQEQHQQTKKPEIQNKDTHIHRFPFCFVLFFFVLFIIIIIFLFGITIRIQRKTHPLRQRYLNFTASYLPPLTLATEGQNKATLCAVRSILVNHLLE